MTLNMVSSIFDNKPSYKVKKTPYYQSKKNTTTVFKAHAKKISALINNTNLNIEQTLYSANYLKDIDLNVMDMVLVAKVSHMDKRPVLCLNLYDTKLNKSVIFSTIIHPVSDASMKLHFNEDEIAYGVKCVYGFIKTLYY